MIKLISIFMLFGSVAFGLDANVVWNVPANNQVIGSLGGNTISGGGANWAMPLMCGINDLNHGQGYSIIPGGWGNGTGNHYAFASGVQCRGNGYASVAMPDNSTANGLCQIIISSHGYGESSNGGVIGDTAADSGIFAGAWNYLGKLSGKSFIAGGSRIRVNAPYTFAFGDGNDTTITQGHLFAVFPNGTPGRLAVNRAWANAELDVNGSGAFSGNLSLGMQLSAPIVQAGFVAAQALKVNNLVTATGKTGVTRDIVLSVDMPTTLHVENGCIVGVN